MHCLHASVLAFTCVGYDLYSLSGTRSKINSKQHPYNVHKYVPTHLGSVWHFLRSALFHVHVSIVTCSHVPLLYQVMENEWCQKNVGRFVTRICGSKYLKKAKCEVTSVMIYYWSRAHTILNVWCLMTLTTWLTQYVHTSLVKCCIKAGNRRHWNCEHCISKVFEVKLITL